MSLALVVWSVHYRQRKLVNRPQSSELIPSDVISSAILCSSLAFLVTRVDDLIDDFVTLIVPRATVIHDARGAPRPRLYFAMRVLSAGCLLITLLLLTPAPLRSSNRGLSLPECLTLADHPSPESIDVATLQRCVSIVLNDTELLADLAARYEAEGKGDEAEPLYERSACPRPGLREYPSLAWTAEASARSFGGGTAPRRGRPSHTAEPRGPGHVAGRSYPRAGTPVVLSLLFLASRLTVLAFVLVTWAYSITSYSPFAFDMFIRPQLLPWLAEFVVWHHALVLWGAYVLSVLTLIPDFRALRSPRPAANPPCGWRRPTRLPAAPSAFICLAHPTYPGSRATSRTTSPHWYHSFRWLGWRSSIMSPPLVRSSA